MGNLADIVNQRRQEAIKPAIKTIGEPKEGEKIFTSKDFSGFAGFLSDEPEEEPQTDTQQEKMMSVFAIMKMLMKILD